MILLIILRGKLNKSKWIGDLNMTSPEQFEILNKVRKFRNLKKRMKNSKDPIKRKKLKSKINKLEKELQDYVDSR